MSSLICNSCNKELSDEVEQKLHYKSEWHRYNLKRKVAGVPGVTEALFQARQSALAEEKRRLEGDSLLYTCRLCNKEYRSSKAYDQHLKSKSHLMQASEANSIDGKENTIIRPLPSRVVKEPPQNPEEEDEWEEVVPGEVKEIIDSMDTSDQDIDEEEEDDEFEDLDPSSCFMCDMEHDSLDACMVHMLKKHGLFIPDIEYLKDPKGLLTYLALKVKKDFLCLYCKETSHPFGSLEAVRKHMEAKSHCKVHYGDGTEDEEADLEEFYDYSCSYLEADGKQLVAADEISGSIELGSGGSELIITRTGDGSKLTRVLGSREYLRYYRQKPRPTGTTSGAITAAVASRYKSMGLATVQSREQVIRMKVLKTMNKNGVEAMRSKIGMKSNVIRNLPKNVAY